MNIPVLLPDEQAYVDQLVGTVGKPATLQRLMDARAKEEDLQERVSIDRMTRWVEANEPC